MKKSQAVFDKFLILNASGVHCTTREELEEVLESYADAVIVKTITLKPREGNPKPRLFYTRDFSLTSMGLPNRGVDYYCKISSGIQGYKKPVFASIAGFSEEEYYKLFKKVDKTGFDAIEVNLSCPNVEASCVFAYDLDLTLRIAEKLRKITSTPLGFKLSPYTERWQIKKLAEGFLKIGVDFVEPRG